MHPAPIPELHPATAALRRYQALAASGKAQAALQAASDACHTAPALPHPHYAYGEAWLALGQPAQAARAFAEAVRLAPDWPDAWINLGLARYREGAVEDAKLAMRQALRADPAHQAAASNLAALMRITGESDTAEVLLRQAIAARPTDAGARLNLAADLLQEERPADALALLDDAPAPPEDAAMLRHALLQRSLALVQLGRTAEARDVLDSLGPVPPALAPLLRWRHVLLALEEGDGDGAAREARAMEAAIAAMGPQAVPEHRITAHYDLAKFWSNRGDRADAFAHWQAGHTLLRATQPFSREANLAFVEASIALLDARRLVEGPRAGNNDPAPVFIVGMPRSGTTLCEQILAAHPMAHGAGERAALGQAAWARGGGEGPASVARIAALESPALDAAADRYLAALHALAPDASRIVDKMPGNYLHVGLAALLLPQAKFIHCVRDPRDIGLSIFTFRFYGAHGYAHDLADLGWTIAQQVRLMAHWKQALPGRVLTVALADWVTDFDATLARVLDHVGLPPDPACARFHEAETRVRTVSRRQVRRRINASGLGRWKPYARELAPLVAELEAARVLDEWTTQGSNDPSRE